MLVEFAENHNLYIMNSFFKKKPSRKWTWRSPTKRTSEIDYILTNKKDIFLDCTVINKFNTGSDHRMVRCKVRFNIKRERSKLMQKPRVRRGLRSRVEFQQELENRLAAFQAENDPISLQNTDAVTKIIIESSEETVAAVVERVSKLSKETLNLMKLRRSTKSEQQVANDLEYSTLCKTLRKNIREDLRKFNMNLVESIVASGRSLHKNKQHLSIGRRQITTLKAQDGSIVRNWDHLLDTVVEFYSALYKDDTDINSDLPVNGEYGDPLPEVTTTEVEYAIMCMKSGKAPGEDGLTIDVLKRAGRTVSEVLARLFTSCLHEENIPESWKNASIIILHKKGDTEDLKNYRPISLLPILYKVFTKILSNRLETVLDENQPREQAGFRRGYSTMDHIQVVREIIERYQEYKLPLYLGFIDYEKAFDSIKKFSIIDALSNQGISRRYINILNSIYSDATACVKLHKRSCKFPINKGVRQGDTISPKLFTATLEDLFRKLDWEEKGVPINGEHLSHLRFADDIVILSQDPKDLQSRMQELADVSQTVGLKINVSKTKVMRNCFSDPAIICISGTQLEQVSSYVYLGQQVSIDGSMHDEIARRTKLGWSAFGRLNSIFKSDLPLCLKRRVFNQCVLPVLTYGCETWTLNTRDVQRLRVTQRGMERCMLGITRKDRKRNEWVRKQTRVRDVIDVAKQLKWRWAGHIARRKDGRWTNAVIQWYPRGTKRPQGRPKSRWIDELVKFGGNTWQRTTQDRESWRKLGEAFIQQWIDPG
jgi:Reverse transcriptase (RNA-dependent DNA polymerase)